MFFSVGNPDVLVPEHSHDEGDGLRIIISGSVYYENKELKSGDWMFIPKGLKYSIKTGPLGATMFYIYQCCCVPKGLNNSSKLAFEGNPFGAGH